VVVAHYKKEDLLNCWTSSSDISSYHVDFHEGHGTVGAWQGRGHGMCELTTRHDRGTARARHAMCESALTVTLEHNTTQFTFLKTHFTDAQYDTY